MLRGVLGDSIFFAALHTYASDARLRFATATTRDFQGVCEAVSGRDLGSFFNQWVFGERFPIYEFSWSAGATETGFDMRLTLNQTTRTSNPSFFGMPIQIRLGGAGRDTTLSVQHTFSGQEFFVRIPFEPLTVTLDPDGWILKEIREGPSLLPSSVALEQNYPNPFNPGTSIRFELPRRAFVTLEVFDLLGRRVATLAEETRDPGTHAVTWDGTESGGLQVASGVYIYRLRAAEVVVSRRMLLLR
jgi:hypothetical protein